MNILVVEDDADLRVEIVEYLERRRHRATGCATIAAARDALDNQPAGKPFDAAICDVGLPDGDGVRFFLESVVRTPACRWILMSGSHDLSRLNAMLRAQEAPPLVLEKPMPLRLLNDALAGKPVPSGFDPDA